MNPSESYVDISTNSEDRVVHWMFEAGALDIFIVFKKQLVELSQTYTLLTGPPLLPRYNFLGYHQCRWNYFNQYEVMEILDNYEKHDMPLDIIWLDIEYSESKRYFI